MIRDTELPQYHVVYRVSPVRPPPIADMGTGGGRRMGGRTSERVDVGLRVSERTDPSISTIQTGAQARVKADRRQAGRLVYMRSCVRVFYVLFVCACLCECLCVRACACVRVRGCSTSDAEGLQRRLQDASLHPAAWQCQGEQTGTQPETDTELET